MLHSSLYKHQPGLTLTSQLCSVVSGNIVFLALHIRKHCHSVGVLVSQHGLTGRDRPQHSEDISEKTSLGRKSEQAAAFGLGSDVAKNEKHVVGSY